MNELLRPTLILDKEKCLRNIQTMAEKAEKYKLKFRPHFKTHQSAVVGEWFREFGVDSITVSSITMAEYFASNGWNDITLAFPVNIHEIENINRLAANIKFNVTLENKDAAKKLAESVRYKLGVYLKIDTGYHRTGISSSKTSTIDSILAIIANNSKLTFKGFLSHTGHTYEAKSQNEIYNRHFDALFKLNALKRRYQKNYTGIEISVGDTPSASICTNFNGVSELRPGNFVFYDLTQLQLGTCTLDDIAVRMACPVVSTHFSRNEVVIYGGAAHFSRDYILNTDGKPMYGRIVLNNDGTQKLLDTKNYLSKLSQEHGILKVTPNQFRKFKVGDFVEIIPIHSCLTASCMRHYQTTDGELIKMMPNF